MQIFRGYEVNTLASGVESPNDDVSSQEHELAELIVSTLNLEVGAADIQPEAPLYREGLGLDSIDILEVALAVSKAYGFKLRAEDDENLKVFGSLRSLNLHIQQHRSR